MLTVELVNTIVSEARAAAYAAAEKYVDEYLGGRDGGACGFAWINIYHYEGVRLKGNTKAGRVLKAAGIDQDWNRIFIIWSPANYPVQSVDAHHAGACAAAEVFKKYGFDALACSRLD